METRSTKIVALFDILGTKERMVSHGIDGVLDDYRNLASSVDSMTGSMVVTSVPTGDGSFCPAVGYLEVEQTYFSDTFVVWADYQDIKLPAFFEMCSELFCHSIELGLPLRGGIDVGEAYMDKQKNIFLGSALIDAALAETAGQWLGVSFGVSFNAEEFLGPFDPRTILPYKKHHNPKKNYSLPGLTLDWPRKWRSTRTEDIGNRLSQMDSKTEFSKYYRNSKDFVEFSDENHDWFNNKDSLGIEG